MSQPSDPSRAAERTALAWNRTGMSFVVVGAGVLKTLPVDGRGAVGIAMIVIGAITAAYGWRISQRHSPAWALRGLSVASTGLALAALAIAAFPR
jgi:uncharacterized membrane protein YidH (DUF202 family)